MFTVGSPVSKNVIRLHVLNAWPLNGSDVWLASFSKQEGTNHLEIDHKGGINNIG